MPWYGRAAITALEPQTQTPSHGCGGHRRRRRGACRRMAGDRPPRLHGVCCGTGLSPASTRTVWSSSGTGSEAHEEKRCRHRRGHRHRPAIFDRLLADGWSVVGLDMNPAFGERHRAAGDRGVFVVGDVADQAPEEAADRAEALPLMGG
jgi:hypothetical protein